MGGTGGGAAAAARPARAHRSVECRSWDPPIRQHRLDRGRDVDLRLDDVHLDRWRRHPAAVRQGLDRGAVPPRRPLDPRLVKPLVREGHAPQPLSVQELRVAGRRLSRSAPRRRERRAAGGAAHDPPPTSGRGVNPLPSRGPTSSRASATPFSFRSPRWTIPLGPGRSSSRRGYCGSGSACCGGSRAAGGGTTWARCLLADIHPSGAGGAGRIAAGTPTWRVSSIARGGVGAERPERRPPGGGAVTCLTPAAWRGRYRFSSATQLAR